MNSNQIGLVLDIHREVDVRRPDEEHFIEEHLKRVDRSEQYHVTQIDFFVPEGQRPVDIFLSQLGTCLQHPNYDIKAVCHYHIHRAGHIGRLDDPGVFLTEPFSFMEPAQKHWQLSL
jgi:hypothetical protein